MEDINKNGGTNGSGASSSDNTVVGGTKTPTRPSKEDNIRAAVNQMKRNSMAWHTASKERQKVLEDENFNLSQRLESYGVHAVRGADGTWYLDRVGGRKLYDVYHKGGIVGNNPTLKQNEVMAVLEQGEAVLDEQKEKGLYRLVEFATTLSDKFAELIKSADIRQTLAGHGSLAEVKADVPANISDNREIRIEFGDTYITGTNEETVEKHRAITRQQANELLDQLKIKR